MQYGTSSMATHHIPSRSIKYLCLAYACTFHRDASVAGKKKKKNTSDQIVGINRWDLDHPPLILLLLRLGETIEDLNRQWDWVRARRSFRGRSVDSPSPVPAPICSALYTFSGQSFFSFLGVHRHIGTGTEYKYGALLLCTVSCLLLEFRYFEYVSYRFASQTTSTSQASSTVQLSNSGPRSSQNRSIRPFVRSLDSLGNAHVSACISMFRFWRTRLYADYRQLHTDIMSYDYD